MVAFTLTNSRGLCTSVNYYLVTPEGETGPFTVDVLDEKLRLGELRGDAICRGELSKETLRLDVLFPGKSGEYGTEAEMWWKRRKKKGGFNSTAFGVILLVGMVLLLYSGAELSIFTLLIPAVGVGFIIRGVVGENPRRDSNDRREGSTRGRRRSKYDY
jgi:hypothetical protein